MTTRALLTTLLATTAFLVTAPAASGQPSPRAAATCAGEPATIVGTRGADRLIGTRGADVIVARAGRDVVRGRGGKDLICGGGGADRLSGGRGADRLLGQRGGIGNDSGDFFQGDYLVPGPGDDTVNGGDRRGADTVDLRHSSTGVRLDLARGRSVGEDTDRLRALDRFALTRHDDTVTGMGADVEVLTGRGADTITDFSHTWHGVLSTGGGPDVVEVGASSRSGSGIDLGRGDDTAEATGVRHTFYDGRGDDTIRLVATSSTVVGGAGSDLVVGSAGRDRVYDALGDDTYRLGDGVDQAFGALGDDTYDLGGGNDTLSAHRGADDADGGAGIDRIDYDGLFAQDGIVLDLHAGTVTHSSGDDTVAGFERAAGSPRSDELWGSTGDDELVSRSGRDLLHGRGGDDVLLLVRVSGTVEGHAFHGGAGTDLFEVDGFLGRGKAMRIDLGAEQVTGVGRAPITGVENVTDNGGDHILIGDDGPNILLGLRGDDTLRGLGGDDLLLGARGDDDVDGGDGTDTCGGETTTDCEA